MRVRCKCMAMIPDSKVNHKKVPISSRARASTEMNTIRGYRFDTVGSKVLQWIVWCYRECTVSSTDDVANCVSMHADNIHGTWIFSQNADNIHRTWIFPQNEDNQNTVE